jgi:hypothetical protein
MNFVSSALRYKKFALAFLRIVCVIAIFWLISIKIKLPDLNGFSSSTFVGALVVATLLNVLQSLVCTVRWTLIARSSFSHPPFSRSFWAYLEGSFFNQALPSFVGGDAVRIIRWHENGVSTAAAALTVLLDRVFGALGAAALALIACLLLRGTPMEQYKILLTTLLATSVIFIGTALLFLVQRQTFRRLFENIARLRSLMDIISEWRPGARGMGVLITLGVVGQILAGFAVSVLARALHIELSVGLLVSVTGIILLLSMIPISLAGWGVREAGFIALLAPLGVDSSLAFALGVAFGLSMLVGALPGGVSVLFGLARPR